MKKIPLMPAVLEQQQDRESSLPMLSRVQSPFRSQTAEGGLLIIVERGGPRST